MARAFNILILEDSDKRIESFERCVLGLGPDWQIRLWHDAPTMIAECGEFLSSAALISLDHDLMPRSDDVLDPGTGLQVASFLAQQTPTCPVIIHTSNEGRRRTMHSEFLYGGWKCEMVEPIGAEWIELTWTRRARALLRLRS